MLTQHAGFPARGEMGCGAGEEGGAGFTVLSKKQVLGSAGGRGV